MAQMSKEVPEIIERIANERNISSKVLFEAVEAAVASAAKKMISGNLQVTRVALDRDTGDFTVFAMKEVTDSITDPNLQISLQDAKEKGFNASAGEQIELDVTPADFGRIAAQSAKQVVLQRLREAERDMVFDKFKDKTGDLIVGTVIRYDHGNVILDLGVAEGILPRDEQPSGEHYRYGERVRAIVKDIRRSTKEPQVVLSRRSNEFLLKLFEQEVPEIQDKTVTIRLVAREPGRRSKIAVMSTDSNVDAVGACVGMKGSRVQMIVQELHGERIDIVEYSDDRKRLVSNSLKPAEIESVSLSEDGTRAFLVVRNDQYPLAIGKGGLNARLASRLTNTEIEIISQSQIDAKDEAVKVLLLQLEGVDEQMVDRLMERMIFSYEDILRAKVDGLLQVEGMTEELANSIVEQARNNILGGFSKNAQLPTEAPE
ncbi:MAG TPA: transcription termination factor NusA [bacterium]|nr:transcription termination factor NusA [bacterium]